MLVRPSCSTFEADFAAAVEVVFSGALVCAKALPAPAFDFAPVDLLFNVLEAAFAAFFPVVFGFVIEFLC